MNYYVYVNDQNMGPITLKQMTDMLVTGQIKLDTPCCQEGDQTWQTVNAFAKAGAQNVAAQAAQAAAEVVGAESAGVAADPRFGHTQYTIRRKVFSFLGGQFHIFGPGGEVILYSKMKAFKLKEDIRLYTGEDMKTELLVITARKILDFSSAYDVVDATTKQKVGALKRKGLKSIIRDEWAILDVNDQEVGMVQEDNLILALIRRYVTPLIPQKYHGTLNGKSVCVFKQHFNPFILRITLDFSPDPDGLLDRRLGLAAAILLCAIEGRQG